MNGFTEKEFGPDPKDGGFEQPEKKSNGHDTDPWPVLGDEAYYGIAGEFVGTIAPQTEADPVALLVQFLVYFGNATGRGPYCQVGKDRHFANLYALLVGDTSKARKGLSAGHVRDFYMRIDPEWAEHRIRGGMSSGEGIIHAVRDPVYGTNSKGETKLKDPGVNDKRLLLDEREFYSALTVMKREGNTLSGIIRDAWDCKLVLETLTKKEPSKATKPFVSAAAHITIGELQASLDHTSMANGYANRFLFSCVHRSRELPHGGDEQDLSELTKRTQHILNTARAIERVSMSDGAKVLWGEIYSSLSAGQPGLFGAIVARAEAQTLRLSLIYALLDGAREIDRAHLEAALAVWAFCAASARFIFGDLLGNQLADAILRVLRQAGASGKTRNEINDHFGGHRSGAELQKALELLLTSGKARVVRSQPQRGRPKDTWFAA